LLLAGVEAVEKLVVAVAQEAIEMEQVRPLPLQVTQ
jgi:hypothetical protein